MKPKFILSFLLVFAVVTSYASTIGDYNSGFKKDGNIIYFSNTNGDVKLEFISPSVFRVKYSWDRQFAEKNTYMLVDNPKSKVDVTAENRQDSFLIKTAFLEIKISKKPFLIKVYDRTGKLLNADASTAEKNEEEVKTTKQLFADEHFFGFGERMDFLDRRGKKLTLDVGRGKGLPHQIGAYDILQANYCPVTFFMSTRGYGIFFHNSFATNWDMGYTDDQEYSFSAVDGDLDYFFIYGPDFSALIDQYTDITGKSPLMPKYALGLHVGTYSGGTWGHEDMTSDQYVIELGKRLRAEGIPTDIIWLDSTWRLFGDNGGKGATSFEWRETFKNPKGMFDSLYNMKYKMVGVHLRPRFDNAKKLNLLDQAREKGFTYPEERRPGEFVNFFDQKAVDWWFENGVKHAAEVGAKFLKTDEGSAFGALANESDKVGPTGKEAERLHNLFPLVYAKGAYESFQKYNGVRGLNHTREGYAGIQKYPFIFAGDWPSEWQYFAPVIKAGINIGLSGVSGWAHCMGGFEHPADPELYIRWVQFGMFSPVATVFGMDHPGYKEPWNYGADGLRNFKFYDELRYSMQPYLYASMYQNHLTGLPMMRALVLENQNDYNTYAIDDQYLLGDNLLVCPVTTKGAVTRSVYLPEGDWFDYWTGKKYEGKSYVHVVSPLDTIPLFVKAGGVIPMQPKMAYTDEKALDKMTLEVFPIAKYASKTFTVYDDDGESLAYKDGKYSYSSIRVYQNEDSKLLVDISKSTGDFKPTERTYLAKIRWDDEKAPTSVRENNKVVKKFSNVKDLDNKAGWFYNSSTKILWIQTANNNLKDITISIK
jgi:alpha-glucosidase